MSKIEIQSEGIYILLQLLDEETASAYIHPILNCASVWP
jgi:hypothetical protein